MFTGIIEEVATIRSIRPLGNRVSLTVSARTVLDDLKIGDSIAVNGACLTVTEVSSASFSADVSPETLQVTNLHTLQSGSRVNLERALRASDRLGGHLVQGHVDDTAQILEMRKDADTLVLTVSAPESIRQYIVTKGSITIDGISLTINACTDTRFTCTIIPHTLQQTTLSSKKVGDIVNLESDIIGRYVEKLLLDEHQKSQGKKTTIDMDMLNKHGWE